MIYFAHSKKIYNTETESRYKQLIEDTFPIPVLCPNKDMGELGRMEPYLEKVRKCDIVVCTKYKDFIGKGVTEEVEAAIRAEKPVLCLSKGKFYRVYGTKIYDSTDWSIQYARLVLGSEVSQEQLIEISQGGNSHG